MSKLKKVALHALHGSINPTNFLHDDFRRKIAYDGTDPDITGLLGNKYEAIGRQVAPIALSFIPAVGPLVAAAYSAANNYGQGGSIGSSLLKGGLSYAGSQLGSAVGGGGASQATTDGFGNAIVRGNAGSLLGNSGAVGAGAASSSYGGIGNAISGAYNDVANFVKPVTDGISGAYHSVAGGVSDAGHSVAQAAQPVTSGVSSAANTVANGVSSAASPITNGISNAYNSVANSSLGNGISSVYHGVADAASGLGHSIFGNSTPAAAATTGGQVANNSGSLLGNYAKYSPLLSLGAGAYTNNAAKNDLLDAEKKNQNLLQPFLNQQFTPGDLTQDPGYQFQLAQGNKALDRQQAAKGNYFSGQALQDAQSFGQGLAGTTYNDAFQRYLSNQGQKLGAANSLAGINNDIGNTKAGSITNLGNLFSGTAGSLLGGSSFNNLGQQSGGIDGNLLASLLAKQVGGSSYGQRY